MDSADDPLANMSAPDSQASLVVLIVDDEAPIAEALALIIEDAGYSTLIAYRGREGFELAHTYHPALIITDLMVPQMDGAALISAVRGDYESDHRAPPPIVAMTAGGIRYAQMTGADAVLQKPFTIEEVESLLERFLPNGG